MRSDVSKIADKRILVFGCFLLLLSGCQYQWGSVMHPQVGTIGIGTFRNATKEPGLDGVLREKLAEHVMRDISVQLADTGEADAILEGEVVELRYKQLASIRTRDEESRTDDKDEYQSSIYRVEVEIAYTLRVPGYRNPLIEKQQLQGTADFSHLPDMGIARREAFRVALDDAARRIVSAVTEAW